MSVVHKGYLGVEINVNEPLLVVTETMNNARENLIRVLREEPRNYQDQDRLLTEYQSALRAVDILAGLIDVKGNLLNRTDGLLIDDTTRETAAKTLEDFNPQVKGSLDDNTAAKVSAGIEDALKTP